MGYITNKGIGIEVIEYFTKSDPTISVELYEFKDNKHLRIETVNYEPEKKVKQLIKKFNIFMEKGIPYYVDKSESKEYEYEYGNLKGNILNIKVTADGIRYMGSIDLDKIKNVRLVDGRFKQAFWSTKIAYF